MLADYTQDERYIKATPQEQAWFNNYVITLDTTKAALAAYGVNSEDSARAYGKTVAGRPHIAGLIKAYLAPKTGLPTLEELKQLYMNIYHDPKATLREKLQALTAYGNLSGFNKRRTTNDDGATPFDPLNDLQDDLDPS